MSTEEKRRKVNFDTDSHPALGHKLIFEFVKKYIRNKDVLDIGCWTGQFEELAKNHVKSIIGIDPGAEAIQFAKRKFKSYKNIRFKKDTAQSFSTKKKFDVVLLLEVIEHIPQTQEMEVFENISKVLKPGGLFIVSTPYRHFLSVLLDPAYFLIGHRHYSRKYLHKLLQESGFKILKTKTKGGILKLLNANIALICKHLFKYKYHPPKWLQRKIINEYKREGYAGIIVLATNDLDQS